MPILRMVRKMRLIDADNLGVGKANNVSEQTTFAYGWNSALQAVKEASPAIDPETLPIVRELRAELAEAKAQCDELAALCWKLIVLCDKPKEWQAKMFRRHSGPMIGDYMGSGYPFVDAFNRIFEEFAETASEGTYQAVRKKTDKETGKCVPQKEAEND